MDTIPPKTKLTEKQQRFAEEYLIDFNATQAYIRAGYQVKNKEVAKAAAARLLANINVQAAIKEAKEAIAARANNLQDKVIEQLAKIAFGDPTNYMKFGQREEPVMGQFGPVTESKKVFDPISCTFKTEKTPVTKLVNYVDLNESDKVDGTLIAEIKSGVGASIKLNDRMKALELLGRYFGMFKDNINVTEEKRLEDFMK